MVVAAAGVDVVVAVIADDDAVAIVADHVVIVVALQPDVLDVGIDLLAKAGNVMREVGEIRPAKDEGGLAAGCRAVPS